MIGNTESPLTQKPPFGEMEVQDTAGKSRHELEFCRKSTTPIHNQCKQRCFPVNLSSFREVFPLIVVETN